MSITYDWLGLFLSSIVLDNTFHVDSLIVRVMHVDAVLKMVTDETQKFAPVH